MNNENKEVSAIIPIEKYPIVILIYWLLTFTFGFILFLSFILTIFEFKIETLIVFPISLILTILCLNLAVFYSFGKEKIFIENNELIIQRINQPIKSKNRRIEISKIEKVNISEKLNSNILSRNLNMQSYALEFNKNGKIELKIKPFETITILNGVNNEEAETIKEWIEINMQKFNDKE